MVGIITMNDIVGDILKLAGQAAPLMNDQLNLKG